MVELALYIVAIYVSLVFFSTNIYGRVDLNLLAIVVIVLLLFMHLALAGGVYKSWYLNVIEYSFLNLGILASATTVAEWGQSAVVHTSALHLPYSSLLHTHEVEIFTFTQLDFYEQSES